MNENVRNMLLCVVCLFGCLLLAPPLAAQDYPKGPVQIVIPFSPGGSDAFWRLMGEPLAKILKVPMVFINRPGGGGIVGLASIVNAKPDGYTLSIANSDNLNVTPLFTKELPFDTINDLTYVAKVAMFPQCIVVRTESPFKTIDDLIAFARANPRKVKAATAGVGTTGHLAVNLFNRDANVEVVPIAFAGGGENVPAVLGGHVDCAFTSTTVFKSAILAGQVRILTFFSKRRNPIYPNVPSSVEKGLKRTVAEVGMGMVGPKGLSQDIIKKWEWATQQALKDPNTAQAITKMDFVIDPESGDEYKKEVVDEFAVFKQIAAQLDVKK